MPESNGYEFRKQQLASEELRHIPVFVVSNSWEFKESRTGASPLMFFNKPIVAADLVLLVKTYLLGRRAKV
jgi:hypothetical protein